MLYGSDDEAVPSASSADPRPRPQKRKLELTFLANQCRCKRAVCFQQFLGEADDVRAKREEFSKMENSRRVA